MSSRIFNLSGLQKTTIYQEMSPCLSNAILLRLAKYYQHELVAQGLDKHADYEVGLTHANRLMTENPYQVTVVSYVTVYSIDKLVTALPTNHPWYVAYDDHRRIDAIINALLADEIQEGHAITSLTQLQTDAKDIVLSNTPNVDTNPTLRQSLITGVLNSQAYTKISSTQVMQTDYYRMTVALAKQLNDRSKLPLTTLKEDVLQSVFNIGLTTGETLSDEQQDVVRGALQSPVSLIMGYAGVGKSTLVRAITQYLDKTGQTATLCAYAGKAAFNLTQITRAKASTISSLIYRRKKITDQYLIIDEISMVGEQALADLLNVVANDKTHIVLIGDSAQLPAVKTVGLATSLTAYLAKNPMNNLYSHVLRHVFRQGQGQLLDQATMIRNAQAPTLFTDDDTIKYREIKSRDDAVAYYLAAKKHFPDREISIITGLVADVAFFNDQLQAKLGSKTNQLTMHNKRFCVGDRVLVTHNMYNCLMADSDQTGDVFNGFVGTVVGIKDDMATNLPYVRVMFNHTSDQQGSVYYDFYVDSDAAEEGLDNPQLHYASWDCLELGYALTVHKSQGSTIPIVIYYLGAKTSPKFLSRQLLYTAYTRAQLLIFLTDQPVTPRLLSRYVNNSAYLGNTSYLATALRNLQPSTSSQNI